MRWFDRSFPGSAPNAKFADVSAAKRRMPSWLPNRSADLDRRGESSLRPPRLPSEFVDAVRQELDQEYAARPRASLLPESLGHRSERPSAHAHAPVPVAVNPLPKQESAAAPPAAPVIDPALVQGFEEAILLFAGERERILSETASQLAELAALIARRVIGRELSLDPSVVRGLVREGISALGQHERVLVTLGPGFETMRERLEEDLRGVGSRFEVRFDAALDAYGCRVETEMGQVDESIESRLETLLHALKPDSSVP
jgi:hypothetical protein